MPLSKFKSSPFPIEVTENEWQFMVRIPASQKERASKIPGRRWNPEIERWIYPKTVTTYETLTDEFKRDASVFDIRKPPSRRLPKPENPPDEEDQSLEEWKGLNEKTSEIHEKFNGLEEQIAAILGTVRTVESIAHETQNLLKSRQDSSTVQEQEPPAVRQALDLSEGQDLKIMERSLVTLAFVASGRDQSFAKWISNYKPMFQPHEFVADTHEKIKGAIAGIVGEPNYRKEGFHELMQKLKARDVIEPSLIYLLLAMNQHRNRFGHSENFTESERLTRSIIYLFNLALVWPHIASEPVEDNDET